MAVIITPSDIKIILEGEAVMTNLQSAIKGFVMLFGLIYALNMRYLKCERTYEFVQKVLLGLESKRIKYTNSVSCCIASSCKIVESK
ncbi:hypothetical protein NQD34_002984 [Periophthalmus magnuspinnatus]|nr:hypothetical protein NQD34_002984 [Periophthalmus magnuspinnatus]